MTPLRCVACALQLAALAALAACGGGKVTLRYHPTAGSVFRYALQQQAKIRLEGGPLAQAPGMEMGMNAQLKQAVGGPREGGTAVTWSIDTLSLVAPAGMAAMSSAMEQQLARIRAMSFDFVYDDRMIPIRVKFNDPLGQESAVGDRIRRNATMFSFPLPVDPIGKGDTWRAASDLPLNGVPGASGTLTVESVLTVKDIRISGGDTTVVIGIQTTFPDQPITVTREGQAATVKISGTMTGEQQFSLSQGALVSGKMGGTMKLQVTLPALSAKPIAMSLDQETSMQLAGSR